MHHLPPLITSRERALLAIVAHSEEHASPLTPTSIQQVAALPHKRAARYAITTLLRTGWLAALPDAAPREPRYRVTEAGMRHAAELREAITASLTPTGYTYRYPHPAVTADIIVYTYSSAGIEVLLVQRGRAPFQGMWAIPGGFMDIDEPLLATARRELEEETGVTGLDLIPLGLYDRPERDPRERVISMAYIAVMPKAAVQAGDDATAAHWHNITALPPLAFDHAQILADAFTHLRTIEAARLPDDVWQLWQAQHASPS